jgi:hypothetical protein
MGHLHLTYQISEENFFEAGTTVEELILEEVLVQPRLRTGRVLTWTILADLQTIILMVHNTWAKPPQVILVIYLLVIGLHLLQP